MPELPEVEHLRRSLEPDLIGSRVAAVMVFRSDVIRSRAGPSDLAASDLLEGSTVHRLDRRGKQLAIISEGERGVVIQLGMTGQLRWSAGDRSRGGVDHVHVRWRIVTRDSGVRELEFRDPRRFGGISPFASRLDLEGRLWGNLGPDAAEVAFDALADRLLRSARDSRRPLKSMMLDQSVVAGIGNIYADEALFAAAIHPALFARRLDADMAARLAVEIQRTLQAAIDAGGSTLRDYVDSTGRPGSFQQSHQVYGRTGQPCFRCGKAIRSMTLSGRTTAWCPGCQRRSRLSR